MYRGLTALLPATIPVVCTTLICNKAQAHQCRRPLLISASSALRSQVRRYLDQTLARTTNKTGCSGRKPTSPFSNLIDRLVNWSSESLSGFFFL